MSRQIPLHDGLYSWPAERPQMLGSRCNQCGETAFPAQDDCRHCSASDSTVVPIGDRGTLWTWTIQGFLPKTPYNSGETEETFAPYGVGYVEMPGGVRVEARLRENTPEQLRIGMTMQLEIVPFRRDENGDELMTYVFRACEENDA